MAVHMHDIVEIAGPAPLGECPQLLGEQFGDRVAQNAASRQRRITVRVADRAENRPAREDLVGGDVELHLGEHVLGVRAAVGDASLSGGLAALVLPPPERRAVNGELDAGFLAQPLSDLAERQAQVVWIVGAAGHDCEVEVFREAERFVVALAEAGAALEYPGPAERGVGGDAGQQPAEKVVLFDDRDVERPFGAQLLKLAPGDHDGSCGVIVALIRSLQRMFRRPPCGPPGSRAEMPADSLSWLAFTRYGWSRPSASIT
jgi:hypothetical protein